jgi:hypothetical protein
MQSRAKAICQNDYSFLAFFGKADLIIIHVLLLLQRLLKCYLDFFHVCFNLFQYNMQRKLPNLQKTKSVPYSRYLFSDFILSSLTEKSVWKHLINLTLKRISDSVKYKQYLITC